MIKNKILALLRKIISEKIEISLEIPKEKKFGDYSTNVAFLLAKKAGKNPQEIAEELVKKIEQEKPDFLEKVDTKAGFINFYLKNDWFLNQIPQILEQKENFGKNKIGKNKKVQIEFISANPTGPLTLGNGRGGFLGDTLSKILTFSGFNVEKEYYINDCGNQIKTLGKSILKAQGKNPEIKEDEKLYAGDYIQNLAKKITGDNIEEVGKKAAEMILKNSIQKTVLKMGIEYNKWQNETDLVKSGVVEKTIQELKAKNYTFEKDGAIWFKSTEFGDDKDRVLQKKSRDYTYFASDIAYHLDKIKRGYDLIIDIWGADHHGDVPRITAAAIVFGFKDKLKIILHQFVRLIKSGKSVKMSKRSGEYVTLDELINEVGLDAVRFFFLSKAPETHLDFDLDLAKEKSAKNPVFYVQYANARIQSILAKSEIRPVSTRLSSRGGNPKSEKISKFLKEPAEIELAKQLSKFPDLIEDITQNFQVQKLTFYALETATSFHNFYEKCKVISDDKKLTEARIGLIKATQIVLKNCLDLLGITLPEKM